jgi:hypothetical protein
MNWNVDYNFRDVEIDVHDEGIHEAEDYKHLAFVTSLNTYISPSTSIATTPASILPVILISLMRILRV